MMFDSLIAAFNAEQPDWWLEFAHPQDMTEFAQKVSDGHSGTVQAKIRLQRATAQRLVFVLRAAVHAGIVLAVEKKGEAE